MQTEASVVRKEFSDFLEPITQSSDAFLGFPVSFAQKRKQIFARTDSLIVMQRKYRQLWSQSDQIGRRAGKRGERSRAEIAEGGEPKCARLPTAPLRAALATPTPAHVRHRDVTG